MQHPRCLAVKAIHLKHSAVLPVLVFVGLVACREPAPVKNTDTPVSSVSVLANHAGLDSEAVARIRARFSAHFAGAQGFGIDTLRARKAWFTPCLYSLLLADMQGDSARGGVGYLNWDPFTAAQDNATSFDVERAVFTGDTVVVHLRILYPADNPPTAMAVAATQVGRTWRIANIITPSANLARGLDSSLRAEGPPAYKSVAGCAAR